MSAPDPSSPEFGPSGYLPDRAAKRARKIVLRAPLGLQWVVGALVVGVAVIAAGVLWLQGQGPPPEPWEPVGPVESVATGQRLDALDAIVVAEGRVRVLAGAEDAGAQWCEQSRQLEGSDGAAWSPTGRGLGGTPSLDEHPTQAHEGTLYVDPTRTSPGPAPRDGEVILGC